MLGLKRKKGVRWTVECKMCGRPYPTPLERAELEEIPYFNSYQCPLCGESADYTRDEHHAATA